MVSNRVGKAVVVCFFAAVLITLLGFVYRDGGWASVSHWLFTRGLGAVVGVAAVVLFWWVTRRATAKRHH